MVLIWPFEIAVMLHAFEQLLLHNQALSVEMSAKNVLTIHLTININFLILFPHREALILYKKKGRKIKE